MQDPDVDAYPFSRVRVVPELCIGCQICGTRRYDEALDEEGALPLQLVTPNTQSPQQEGCPWDAIVLVPVEYADEAEGILFDR